jgi:hypothetical protein
MEEKMVELILKKFRGIDGILAEKIELFKQWQDISDSFEDSVIINILKDYADEIVNLTVQKKDIEDIIMTNKNPIHRQILKMRYLKNCSWECIADEICEDVEWVKQQHQKALKIVSEKENANETKKTV